MKGSIGKIYICFIRQKREKTEEIIEEMYKGHFSELKDMGFQT